MRRFIILLLVGLGVAIAAPTITEAQQSFEQLTSGKPQEGLSVEDDPRTWLSYLDSVELELDQRDLLDRPRTNAIAAEVLRVQELARALDSRDAERLLPLKREIDSLVLPSEEGQPTESEEDALLRQNLQERIGELESRRRLARLTITRSENIQNLLIEYETARLRNQLFVRTPSLFRTQTWLIAGQTMSELVSFIISSPMEWWQQRGQGYLGRFISTFLAIIIAAILAYSLRRRLLARIEALKKESDPSDSAKVVMALSVAVADIALPIACFGILAFVIRISWTFETLFMIAIYRSCLVAIVYFTVSGIVRSVFLPTSTEWRLLKVDDSSADKIARRARLIVLITALALWFRSLADTAGIGTPEFAAAFTLIADVAVILLAARILPYRFIPEDTEEPHTWIRITSAIIGLALIAVPLLDLASYSRLASYILLYLIISIITVGMALLIRVVVTEVVNWAIRPERRAVRLVGKAAQQGDLEFLRFVLMLTADILIFVPVIWLLLVLYGIPTAQLLVWLNYFVNGFTIGNVTIAPFDLILGIIVFAAVLLVTNLVRRAVAVQLTDRLQIDVGIRNAIYSAIGYVGIVVAIILAIATIGLDLSNLALVASALSVGIGFGLRTVVENFVAGLLLLIERPIKEGDWIVTGGRDGTVKKISVRSTEVETFDRSTIIVPNSELISQSVENWSHRNRMSRVIIPIGVAYGSDTAKVREILFDCMAKDPNIVRYPEPQVLFLAFGESSLDFQVRYFLPDTNLRMPSISAMHFAIDAAFREAGIEIPFPQRDVHVKSDGQSVVEKTDESITNDHSK